jgi:GH25 family lysozyme M1 (1,4-beta-N-acetylmuramidase)
MSKYSTCPVGIDISHYQPNIDWAFLKGKVDFVILKAGELQWDDQPEKGVKDSSLDSHIQGAYDAGIPCGLYWFHNPAWYSNWSGDIDNMTPGQDRQLQYLQNILATKVIGKSFHFFVLDFERWWTDYTDYNVNKALAKRVTPTWINKSAAKFLDNFEKLYPALVGRTMTYTGKWFVDTYAGTAAYDWLCKRPVWDASYITGSPHGKAFSSWDALRQALPPDKAKPYYHNSTPLLWQCGIAKMPNGQYGTTAFDIDIWYGGNGLGTVEKMRQWMGYAVPAPVDPAPDPELDTSDPSTAPAVLAEISAKLDQVLAGQAALKATLDRIFR